MLRAPAQPMANACREIRASADLKPLQATETGSQLGASWEKVLGTDHVTAITGLRNPDSLSRLSNLQQSKSRQGVQHRFSPETWSAEAVLGPVSPRGLPA